MTAQVSTKVRLVRCPRCHKLLAELPEVLVYMCGGCGIILQAKIRKLETNISELSSQETDSVAKSQQDNVLGLEAKSSNHDIHCYKVESSPVGDNRRCQDEHDDCMDLCQYGSVSDGLYSSPDFTCSLSEGSPVEVNESEECNILSQNPKRYQSELHDDNDGWTADPNVSNEHAEQQHQSDLHEVCGAYHKEDGESPSVWLEDDNLVDEVQNSPEHEDRDNILPQEIKENYVPPENNEKSQTCSAEQDGEIKHAELDSPSGIVSPENDIVSPLVEQVDDGSKDLPISRSSSTEKNISPTGTESILASHSGPFNESVVSFYLTSDEKHLDHCRRVVTCNFERVSSRDTLGSSHLPDFKSELNFKHGSMTNYPTNVSYYAYDGSESSYDGTDYQVRNNRSHPSKNKDVDHIKSTEFLRKDEFRRNNAVNSETERTYWATSSSHRAVKSNHRSQGKSTETKKYTSGNRMRVDIQGDVSEFPFTSGEPVAGRRTRSRKGYPYNLLPPRPGFYLSDKPSSSEPDKFELLRRVCEPKDQLNRVHFPKVTSNRRFSNGRFRPLQYGHLAPDSEVFADMNHLGGYYPRHNRAKDCAERCNVSRLAFSGEATHYRHQVSCPCFHCCPQDWHYSAPLHPHSMHCNNGHHVHHIDHNCCNSSNSFIPHDFSSPKLSLWGFETKSAQRLDNIRPLNLKEKYHNTKRYLRPVAGGAPVVACYHCLELLQLPADFLLFKKRYHQLMCNACRKVLKFSLVKGTHIVPYIPYASAPPPNEVDYYNDATRRRNRKPLSQSSSCQRIEPASYSDNYGQSFCRSSREGHTSVMLPPFRRAERNYSNSKMSSGSSYGPMEDRKMKGILKEPHNKNGVL